MKSYQFLATDSRLHAAGGRVKIQTRRERLDKTGRPHALWPLVVQFCSPLGRYASCPGHLTIRTEVQITSSWDWINIIVGTL